MPGNCGTGRSTNLATFSENQFGRKAALTAGAAYKAMQFRVAQVSCWGQILRRIGVSMAG
jgi:hypothetical protein